ncbi:MFS transporter [Gryllotalpicola protaetiae]|uniref:MFS transporter n=1 Tax=Gryllotalpicola protaetiae TaxID=2419771 RepID=A0A387BMN3_9MICO|nr:MFS transporter [Gryllotalpicola protaetiae]AYG05465.1 MFS transporter [Gryllotalpicola protaetiae]
MTTASTSATGGTVRSLIPARLDRLPWTKFHWSVVVGLGVAWILDGLEVQLVAANGYAHTLNLSSAQVGLVGTIYLVGEVVGSLYFGWLSDRLGRRRLFILTLAIYLVGSGVGGFAFSLWFLLLFRFVAGAGIGGEYAAINSAIDELIPSHYRGRVDIAINGTYWAGAALGAAASIPLFNHDLVPENWGWRIAFWIGPVIGLFIIYLRRHIPESPRWLVTHGREAEANKTIGEIEELVESQGGNLTPVDESKALELKPIEYVPFRVIARTLFRDYPKRTVTAAAMMITQSFLYNAIFFSYALVLQNFYGIPNDHTGYFFFPFAIGNLIGPLVLGPLFDTVGRRKMIFTTYVGAGVVLTISAILFQAGALNAVSQTIFWCVAFFLASAGASSAYLTVSETFPLELRAQAISYFFAVAQIVGAVAPFLFGALVGDGSSRGPLTIGYFVGAGIMIIGGVIALIFGTDAERKSLEDISAPISLVLPR